MTPAATVATTARLTSDYLLAERRLSELAARWASEWPTPPDAITAPVFVRDGELERALDGEPIEPVHKVLSAEHFRGEIRRCRRGAESAARRGKPVDIWNRQREDMEAAFRLAEGYEAECSRVRNLSAFDVAREERNAARRALVAHVAAMMAAEPTTRGELGAQAHALQSVAFVPPPIRAAEEIAGKWMARFAAAVLRLDATSKGDAA